MFLFIMHVWFSFKHPQIYTTCGNLKNNSVEITYYLYPIQVQFYEKHEFLWKQIYTFTKYPFFIIQSEYFSKQSWVHFKNISQMLPAINVFIEPFTNAIHISMGFLSKIFHIFVWCMPQMHFEKQIIQLNGIYISVKYACC